MKTNFVESEFAPLKRVVLAQSQFYFPEGEDELDTSFLSEANIKLFKNKVGDIGDLYPDMQKKWEKEKEQMLQLLASYDVEVIRPRKLTTYEKTLGKESGHGYANFFSRDPFFTLGNFIIEGNLRFAHRRLEISPIRAILKEESKHAEHTTTRFSEGSESETGPFLEGKRCFGLWQKNICGIFRFGQQSKWNQLAEDTVSSLGLIRLHPDIMHLDCALSMVKDGLIIYCEEAFLDGLPNALDNWDKITISLKEASY